MLAARTEDIECRWTETTDFVTRWKAFYNPSDTDASATTQSFLRQEAEALSLKTKWHVLKCNSSCGAQPLNLQHDGLVARCGKIPPSKMRAMFEEYSSKVLRYHQPVKNKTMINTTSTNPSPEAIQRDWSYIEAIHTVGLCLSCSFFLTEVANFSSFLLILDVASPPATALTHFFVHQMFAPMRLGQHMR